MLDKLCVSIYVTTRTLDNLFSTSMLLCQAIYVSIYITMLDNSYVYMLPSM